MVVLTTTIERPPIRATPTSVLISLQCKSTARVQLWRRDAFLLSSRLSESGTSYTGVRK